MLKKRSALGYREVKATEASPFLRKGSKLRGHEFHYSKLKGAGQGVKRLFEIEDGIREGFLKAQTLATYVHLHFASNPSFACGFVRAARKGLTGAR
jgi:cobyrinic acid a,c-diamide synthase